MRRLLYALVVSCAACGGGSPSTPEKLGVVEVVLGSSTGVALYRLGEDETPARVRVLSEGAVRGPLLREAGRVASQRVTAQGLSSEVVDADGLLLTRVLGEARLAGFARDGRALYLSTTATSGLTRFAVPGSAPEPISATLGRLETVGPTGALLAVLSGSSLIGVAADVASRTDARVELATRVVAFAADRTQDRVMIMTATDDGACGLVLARLTGAGGPLAVSREAVAQELACAAGSALRPPERLAWAPDGQRIAFTVRGGLALVLTGLVDLPLDSRLPLAPLWTAPRPIRSLAFSPGGELLLAAIDGAAGGLELYGFLVGSANAVLLFSAPDLQSFAIATR